MVGLVVALPFAAGALVPLLSGARPATGDVVLAVVTASLAGLAVRSAARLGRRRLYVDAAGIRAVGWPEPVAVPAHRVTRALVAERRPPALVLTTATGEEHLELVGFDVAAVRARLRALGVPGGDTHGVRDPRWTGGAPVAPPADVVVLRPRVLRTLLLLIAPALISVFLVVASGRGIVRDLTGRAPMAGPEWALALLLGGAGLVALVGMLALVSRLSPRRRIACGPDALQLVAPTEPHRPVRLPWTAIASIGLVERRDVTAGADDDRRGLLGAAGRQVALDRLEVTLRHRPADDAVLGLLETAPGLVAYPLDGFDPGEVTALVRRVTGHGHRPAPGAGGGWHTQAT
ncbi:hypothetical protein [Pseudonocardia spirodelae]|uniref:PH domain-containing protein n=1 Tax=Pseudonocardia spirodelae TaxID=3133431 RepID=A0ABU8T5Y3_9PSEU